MVSAKVSKSKAKGFTAAAFNEAALVRLTTKLDTTLEKPVGERTSGKRKIRGDADGSPKRRKVEPDSGEDGQKQGKMGSKPGNTGKPKSSKTSKEAIMAEIRALGGDEEDYELIQNVDSDAEEGEPHAKGKIQDIAVDAAFLGELKNLASALGFQELAKEDDAATEASEHGNGAEDEERIESGEDDDGDFAETSVPHQHSARKEKQAGKLIFQPRPDWYGLDTDGFPVSDEVEPYRSAIVSLKAYAEDLLDQDSKAYSTAQASSSSRKLLSTFMTSGTLTDKISALTLTIQESPLHCRHAFDNLINLSGKKSRGQAITALGALVDLLGNGSVLPSDRRLRYFDGQPALLGSLRKFSTLSWKTGQNLPGKITQAHLVMWAYEDWLKSAYYRIIQLLEVWIGDEIEYSRTRALDYVYGLLKDKPEQEANLLRLLVNKLGDPDRKIASRASYLILQLLNLHPGMKSVVIKTVEHDVLLKPNQTLRSRYGAINTLNQTILSGKEPSIADSLLRIYFDLFLSLLRTGSLGQGLDCPDPKPNAKMAKGRGKKAGSGIATVDAEGNQEACQKLVSALLTGVNRAVPFATADDSTLEKHLDTLFRITHSSNFNTSVQALMLIHQLASSKHLAVDRFYRTLYESLIDPRLLISSKQALYLNLLYRSLKDDVDTRRVKAFVKRLVQILNLHQPSFTCGVLFLISELRATFPDIEALLSQPEDHDEDAGEMYVDVDELADGETPDERGLRPKSRPASVYDGRKRNPEHSNAHLSCLWELVPFLNHFHPSVAVLASNIVIRQKSLPKPDLASHTLIHFLDKFVYRNPKATESSRGASIMQPLLASSHAVQAVKAGKAGAKQQPNVNTAAFWNLSRDQVSAEDAFFHEYFTKIGKPGKIQRAKAKMAQVAGSDDEAGEDEIWKALVHSRPDVQGEEDDESVDMEGYEDSSADEEGLDEGVDTDDEASGFEGIFADSEEEDAADPDEAVAGIGEEKEPQKGKKLRLSRKEMKALPTFASADEYAEMLAAEEDGI